MNKTTLMTLAAVLILAGAAQAALISNPSEPSSGKYLRLANREILNWRAPYVVTIDGFANGGLLHENKTCEFPEEGDPRPHECEVTANSTNCFWKSGTPWTSPSVHADFDYGRCASIRTHSDGHDARIEARPAVRLAARAIEPSDIAGIQGEWSWRFKFEWVDVAGDLEAGLRNPNGEIINPTYVTPPLSGCTVDINAQDPSLGGAHYFADCVWNRSGEFDPVAEYLPAGLEACATAEDCRDAEVNGFYFTGELYLNGVLKTDARIACFECFDPVVKPWPGA